MDDSRTRSIAEVISVFAKICCIIPLQSLQGKNTLMHTEPHYFSYVSLFIKINISGNSKFDILSSTSVGYDFMFA